MNEIEINIRNHIRKVQNNEISEDEFINFIENENLMQFYNENENSNLINLLAGTVSSGLPIKITLLKYYLKTGLSPNLITKGKNRNSLFSCSHNYEMASLLIEYGADVNNLDFNGYSFIMYGTTLDVYKLAIESGINLAVTNTNGYNFLVTLFTQNYGFSKKIRVEQKEILTDLLSRKLYDLNKPYVKNLTILNFAIIYGDIPLDCIKLLIQNGADPRIKLNQNLEFRNWNDEIVQLKPELDAVGVLESKLNSLISDNEKGFVTEEIYFKEGVEYYTNAIETLKTVTNNSTMVMVDKEQNKNTNNKSSLWSRLKNLWS